LKKKGNSRHKATLKPWQRVSKARTCGSQVYRA
jgi:hypothetical protein